MTPYPVLPLTHGGRIRTYRLATALAATGAGVDVLCPWDVGEPVNRFRREGVNFQPHFLGSNVLPFVLRDRLVPSPVALSLQPFALVPNRWLRRGGPYDVVQFDFAAHPGWMERMRADNRIVYSAHNVEYDYWRAQERRTVWRGALRRVGTLERRAVAASDLVVVTTEADASRLSELYGRDAGFAVVPNGFDESLLSLDRGELRQQARAELGIGPTETALVFVGGPAAHNRDAVAFLERELAPRLDGDARLFVVGKAGTSHVGREHDSAVRRLGYVDDLARVLAAADVALNPVSFGSGSNLKLPEYLAAGLPVVTTPIGMRGFEHLAEWLTVAELPDFAAAVRAPKPVPQAVRAQLADWSWSSLGRSLRRAYDRLVNEEPRERRR